MRDIKLCYPQLQEAWKYSQEKWQEVNPNKSQPIITCTLRTLAEQKALYAQGRKSLEEINALRKLAKMEAIEISQAKQIITNADAGKSKHNPDKTGLSRAFDIGFISMSSGANHSLDWSYPNFIEFYKILHEKYPKIEWGGNWKSFKDMPHFETL